MTTFQQTIAAAAHYSCKRCPGCNPSEVEQEIWVSLLESSDLPPNITEWVFQNAKRIANREFKRNQRSRTKCFSVIERDDCPSVEFADYEPTNTDQFILNEFLNLAIKDDFDRDTISVLTGQHPQFATFRELALDRFPQSISSAYRAKEALLRRVRKLYEILN